MGKLVQIENQTLDFIYIQEANCWRTSAIIDRNEVEIEIDMQFHKQKEVDWIHFEEFYKFINHSGRLSELVKDSEKLVHEMGLAFFRLCVREIENWKMGFINAIYYNGKVDENNRKTYYSYSLLYHFAFTENSRTWGDDYGLYIVDIENLQIVGVKRHQC